MVDSQVDQIVLGCTHYPFFKNLIKEIIPDHIQIIDPAPAIALHLRAVLEKYNDLSVEVLGSYRFYSTGEIFTLKSIVDANFKNIELIEKITLDTN